MKNQFWKGRIFQMDEINKKTFAQMSSRELFCVLTGDRGIMAQMFLQNLIREYMKEHEEEASLKTMVDTMLKEEGRLE